MGDERTLESLRAAIDAIDDRLLELIAERGRRVLEIAEHKARSGADNHYYRPEREAQILRRVQARNPGPLPDEAVARLFREIMSACLALEAPMRIAYLGPEGTYTQNAALKHFGHGARTVPLASIDAVFREVEAGEAGYGVVPVENSTEGVVTHTLDRLLQSPLKICGEVELAIQHHLLGRARRLEDVEAVVAHQQSLAQCRQWLAAHLPRVEIRAVASNAEAARQAAEDPRLAAIAGSAAAETYDLALLARNIEDLPGNTTRFLVIGAQAVPPSGDDKTSFVVSSRNRPGALYRLLKPLAEQDISMSRIESRPSRQALWEYVFFIDIEGHIQDPRVARVMEALEGEAAFLRLLGSYPKAVL